MVVGQAVLDFVQQQLDAGHSNEQIIARLSDDRHIVITVRTLQRWIRANGLTRPSPASAAERPALWMPEVERLIRSGITPEYVLSHIEKEYDESISLRTLKTILQVSCLQRSHLSGQQFINMINIFEINLQRVH